MTERTTPEFRQDLLALVDATSGDWDGLGQLLATRFGVVSEIADDTDAPATPDEGRFDPLCLRWHDLGKETSLGTPDRRLAITVVDDAGAPYADVREDDERSDAPFGQVELFTSENRSTRHRDTAGRVALGTSFRQIVDSEDGRYALAQTLRELEISAAEGTAGDGELPEGITILEGDSGPGSTLGDRVVISAPGDSGALVIRGAAAVAAARLAAQQGGSFEDVRDAAIAAAQGREPPELTRERDGAAPGGDHNPDGGGIEPADIPAGYVYNGSRIGLTGSFWTPNGALGAWFAGRDGTPIGPLPMRHDAQVHMPDGKTGRILFDGRDAAPISEGDGKYVKGWMFFDTSRANLDTELGLESGQWRPVIRVDTKLPPSGDPPPKKKVPPAGELPEDDDESGDPGGSGGGDPGGAGGGGDPGGGGGGDPGGDPGGGGGGGDPLTGQFGPEPDPITGPGQGSGTTPTRPVTGGTGGNDIRVGGDDGTIVDDPASQARDFSGSGTPCINDTSGTAVDLPSGGTEVDSFGFDAVSFANGALQLGGALTALPNQGVFGLPTGNETPGRLVFVPGPDDGIPAFAQERAEARARAAARDAARAEQKARSDARAKALRDEAAMAEEEAASATGRVAEAAAKRAENLRARADRVDARQKAREDHANRFKRYHERKDREKAEAKAKRDKAREERQKERRRKLEERRRNRKKRTKGKPGRNGAITGAFIIDTTAPEDLVSVGDGSSASGFLTEEETSAALQSFEIGGHFSFGGVLAGSATGSVTGTIIGGGVSGAAASLARSTIPAIESGASFGDFNVANTPVPYFGSEGGAQNLEHHLHWLTAAVNANQTTLRGVFGGPSYYAGNMAVRERERPGHKVAGSSIGTHHTGTAAEDEDDLFAPALEVISVVDLEGAVSPEGSGILSVAREHRGAWGGEDRRPLILLDNHRGLEEPDERVVGDLLSTVDRKFFVDAEAGVEAQELRTHGRATFYGGANPVYLERLDAGFGIFDDEQDFVSFLDDGTTYIHGNCTVDGDLTVVGYLDPTGLGLTPQAATSVPGTGYGIWVDSADGELYYDALGISVQISNVGGGDHTVDDAGTNNAVQAVTIGHGTSATPAGGGFGAYISFDLDDDTDDDVEAGRLLVQWLDPTGASSHSEMAFYHHVNNVLTKGFSVGHNSEWVCAIHGNGLDMQEKAANSTPPSNYARLVSRTTPGFSWVLDTGTALDIDISALTTTRAVAFQDAAGTLALTSDIISDHGGLAGLTDDDHTIYALLAGRSGGQTLQGGTGASEHLTLESTSNATKGDVKVIGDLVPNTDNAYDLGTASLRWRTAYLGTSLHDGTNAFALPASAGTLALLSDIPSAGDHLVDSGSDQGGDYTAVTISRESSAVFNGLDDGAGVRVDYGLEDHNDNPIDVATLVARYVKGTSGGHSTPSAELALSVLDDSATLVNLLTLRGELTAGGGDDPEVWTHAKTAVKYSSALTSSGAVLLELRHNTSGLAAAGLAGELRWTLQDAGGNDEPAAGLTAAWADATDGSEDSTLTAQIAVASVLEDALILGYANSKHLATFPGQLLIEDTDASPVADRQLAVIDGIFEAQTTGGTEGRYISKDSIEQLAIADLSDGATAIVDGDFSAGEGFMRKTGAGTYEAIKSNLGASTAPTATDDSGSGYAVGSRWIDTTANKEYVCLDATATAAVWTETTQNAASPLTTDGDLWVYNSGDTRLPAGGTTGHVLTCDLTLGPKMKWAAAGSSSATPTAANWGVTSTGDASKTLVDGDNVVQLFAPTTAGRTCTFPVLTTSTPFFVILNEGTEALILSSTGGTVRFGRLEPGEGCRFFTDGSEAWIVKFAWETAEPNGGAQVMAFGGNMNTTGNYAVIHGTSAVAQSAALDYTSEGVVSVAATLTWLAHNVSASGGTLKIWKNGATSTTVSSISGQGVHSVGTSFAAADEVGIEYDAGTAPGAGLYWLMFEDNERFSIGFAGDPTATGQFFEVAQDVADGLSSTLSELNQACVPVDCQSAEIAYNTQAAATTTQVTIYKNGADSSGALALGTALTGVKSATGTTFAAGDLVALEYTGSTDPNDGNYQLTLAGAPGTFLIQCGGTMAATPNLFMEMNAAANATTDNTLSVEEEAAVDQCWVKRMGLIRQTTTEVDIFALYKNGAVSSLFGHIAPAESGGQVAELAVAVSYAAGDTLAVRNARDETSSGNTTALVHCTREA